MALAIVLVTLFLLVTTIVVYSTGSPGGTICTDSGVLGDVGVVRSTGAAGVPVQLVVLVTGYLGIVMWVTQHALTGSDTL